MSAGPYSHDSPISLTLAADQQFGLLHPSLDAVWQVSLNPDHALSLNSSFGLRACSFTLLPIFQIYGQTISNSSGHFAKSWVQKIYSNYVSMSIQPARGFQAYSELWARSSTCLLGRFTLTNTQTTRRDYGLQLAANLVPIGAATGMSHTEHKGQVFLEGQTSDISVAVALECYADSSYSPYPSLQVQFSLLPSETRSFQWRCSIRPSAQENRKDLFAPFLNNWEGESARLKQSHHTNLVEIITSESDWNDVFQSSQNQAHQALVRTSSEPESLRLSALRNRDSSYAAAPKRIAALQLWQLSQVLLPAHPDIITTLLQELVREARLTSADAQTLPFPCLAQLTHRLQMLQPDNTALLTLLPYLQEITLAWFNVEHDADQDGLPEWSSLTQSGMSTNPSFDFLVPARKATRIATTESAGLAALLLAELEALASLAEQTGALDCLAACQQKIDTLQESLSTQMNASPQHSTWDRDSHESPSGETLFSGAFGRLKLPLVPAQPARLNLSLLSGDLAGKPEFLRISGIDFRGNTVQESISGAAVLRLPGSFFAVSQHVYRQLEQLEIADMDAETRLEIYSSDLTGRDVASFLSIQPGSASTEADPQGIAWLDALGERARFGIPEFLAPESEQNSPTMVNPAWNTLLIDHLIRIGAKKQAFALFSRLMQGSIAVLKQGHCLFEGFDSQSAQPYGSRNAVLGLAPISSFLEIAGITIYNPGKVLVSAENPLPWPLTVRFRGLEIMCDGPLRTITMPDGTVYQHDGSQDAVYENGE